MFYKSGNDYSGETTAGKIYGTSCIRDRDNICGGPGI